MSQRERILSSLQTKKLYFGSKNNSSSNAAGGQQPPGTVLSPSSSNNDLQQQQLQGRQQQYHDQLQHEQEQQQSLSTSNRIAGTTLRVPTASSTTSSTASSTLSPTGSTASSYNSPPGSYSGGPTINTAVPVPSNSVSTPMMLARISTSGGTSASSVVGSTTSMSTSTYRHHHSPGLAMNMFDPSSRTGGSPARPILQKDANHQPKTRGSLGILVIGLGGANGTTLLAGILANRSRQTWRGPRGEPMEANYNGCITQLDEKPGVNVGYRGRIPGLADASMAAIGGWDIRPTKLGDALLDAQILDYDLVRQLQDEMNKVKVFRGYYDERFIGASQHATATHVLSEREASSTSEALKCLRADIRYFKWRNGVVGHTTVIWSASVEPNSERVQHLTSARDVLESIDMTEQERGWPIPPSLLYATAALLEGCSFVNGGSQNTLGCPGLLELAHQQLGVYCLGTDFKAGQTKFKTAAVEYLRTMGLTPTVIASSNHLGNNDMRNLDSKDTSAAKAKLRVKKDIFAPWEEDIDHKVSIMYTPFINDEKRDYVEYTSIAFLGQVHTMVTYTRASDSVLCVPLMIDVAVWCDFFSSRSWNYDKVAKALAYLFKVPEGAAKGMDPGFFAQMQELTNEAVAASEAKKSKRNKEGEEKRVRIRPEEKTTEWAIPNNARIICGGLACVDMQLNRATGGDGGESIETFAGEKSIGGGSVSMACKTLARLTHGAPLNDGYMTVAPPVISAVVPLCKLGNDDTGNKLVSLLENCGEACRNVETKHIIAARRRDAAARTALAVLPIYKDGRRGCFFDAASNATFSPKEMTELIHSLSKNGPDIDTSNMSVEDFEEYQDRTYDATPAYGSFLFGYPHLLPQLQGAALTEIFVEARNMMVDGGIIALDLNGVPEANFERGDMLRKVSDLRNDPVIGPALEHVDILHMNEDELQLLTGCKLRNRADTKLEDEFAIASAVNLFLLCGVAIVVVTRGKQGSYVSCNDEARFRRSPMLPSSWVDCTTKLGIIPLPPNTLINTNGAGDSFTAGFLVAAMLRHTGMTIPSPTRSGIMGHNSSDLSVDPPSSHVSPIRKSPSPAKKKKKLTPYQLYMRENYVTLKQQCNDDKKAIFTLCHEKWENESEDVKTFYERQAEEEEQLNEASQELQNQLDVLDSAPRDRIISSSSSTNAGELNDAHDPNRNVYMTNRALNLESAVQFASLVAAHHVDTSTRDLTHLDITRLLERSMTLPDGLEEI